MFDESMSFEDIHRVRRAQLCLRLNRLPSEIDGMSMVEFEELYAMWHAEETLKARQSRMH